MFDEAKMRTLRYSLMAVGMALALGGVVAVFNFDQPSDVFSLAWWMIVGGWCLAFTGMGVDIIHVLQAAKHEPAYLYQPEAPSAKEVEGDIARI
jgi:protein-S-isoprenylcysteine O-methyltransferase Ste14